MGVGCRKEQVFQIITSSIGLRKSVCFLWISVSPVKQSNSWRTPISLESRCSDRIKGGSVGNLRWKSMPPSAVQSIKIRPPDAHDQQRLCREGRWWQSHGPSCHHRPRISQAPVAFGCEVHPDSLISVQTHPTNAYTNKYLYIAYIYMVLYTWPEI